MAPHNGIRLSKGPFQTVGTGFYCRCGSSRSQQLLYLRGCGLHADAATSGADPSALSGLRCRHYLDRRHRRPQLSPLPSKITLLGQGGPFPLAKRATVGQVFDVITYLNTLMFQLIRHRLTKVSIPNVMCAVSAGWPIASRNFMWSLGAGLDPAQTLLDGKIDSLIITNLKM